MSELSVPIYGTKNPPVVGDVALKKKRSHDLAYVLIILALLFGTFLFVMILVNSMLSNAGI